MTAYRKAVSHLYWLAFAALVLIPHIAALTRAEDWREVAIALLPMAGWVYGAGIIVGAW